ncbi:MAG: GNAT family N-acetyltransferase, partial [Planctomycetota bacterium]|nr:GNAT family N-acetyltransferase [Planctomycetota bacterium]
RMYFIAAGRDEQTSDPSIGLLLHAFSIRWAIENKINAYDFCHGNESYKYSLGAIDRKIQRLEIRRRSHVQIGRFDSFCLGQALEKIVRYMKTDRVSDAILACQYLREFCQ